MIVQPLALHLHAGSWPLFEIPVLVSQLQNIITFLEGRDKGALQSRSRAFKIPNWEPSFLILLSFRPGRLMPKMWHCPLSPYYLSHSSPVPSLSYGVAQGNSKNSYPHSRLEQNTEYTVQSASDTLHKEWEEMSAPVFFWLKDFLTEHRPLCFVGERGGPPGWCLVSFQRGWSRVTSPVAGEGGLPSAGLSEMQWLGTRCCHRNCPLMLPLEMQPKPRVPQKGSWVWWCSHAGEIKLKNKSKKHPMKVLNKKALYKVFQTFIISHCGHLQIFVGWVLFFMTEYSWKYSVEYFLYVEYPGDREACCKKDTQTSPWKIQ